MHATVTRASRNVLLSSSAPRHASGSTSAAIARAAFASLTALVGCGGSEHATEADVDSAGPVDADTAAPEVQVGTAVIGVAGGTLRSTDGRVTVTVPPFAVESDTTFSIALAANAPGGVRLGPA